MGALFDHPLSNMSSGIEVSQAVVDAYNEIKLSHKYRYVIVKFNSDKTTLEVEKTGAPSATYDDFTSQLPENECRYGVFDLEYSKDNDGSAKRSSSSSGLLIPPASRTRC